MPTMMRGSLRLAIKQSAKDSGPPAEDRSGDDAEPRRRPAARPKRAKKAASTDAADAPRLKRKQQPTAADVAAAAVVANIKHGKREQNKIGATKSPPAAGRKRPPQKGGASTAPQNSTRQNTAKPAAAAGTAGRKRPPEEMAEAHSPNDDALAKIDDFLRRRTMDERVAEIKRRPCQGCGEVKPKDRWPISNAAVVRHRLCRACMESPPKKKRKRARKAGVATGASPSAGETRSSVEKKSSKKDVARRSSPTGASPGTISTKSTAGTGQPWRVIVVVTKPSRDAKLGLGLQQKKAAGEGVRVSSIASDGLFAGTSLEEGMVLESVDGRTAGSFEGCLKLLKEAEGRVTVVATSRAPEAEATLESDPVEKVNGGAEVAATPAEAEAPSPANDDDLLPQNFKPGKDGRTPVGRLKTCMCPAPAECRAIMVRWARLKEGRYVRYQTFPHASSTAKAMPRAPGRQEHARAYKEAVLRSFGYPTDGSKIVRTVRAGTQETTIDKVFSEDIAIVHFHPDVISHLLERAQQKVHKCDRWRVPLDLGEKLGLNDEDKCPTLDTKGDQTFFALPNYSLEQAQADVERAEEHYKQKVREFQAKNKSLLSDMAANPGKYVMKVAELEDQNEKLIKEVKELKVRLRKDLTEKTAMEKKHERLERGLEKVARRMDAWESAEKVGGITNRDAKDIYKWATGKDLSEEGYFGVVPAGGAQKYPKGRGHKRWTDPRMDRAVQAKWDNPSMSNEDALRAGGFDFPQLGEKGVIEKRTLDSDGVSVTERKGKLLHRLRRMKDAMKRKAAHDPEAAREYAQRYPEVEPPVEGIYAGLDLRDIPDQPLVHSKASGTGFRGVKKTAAGNFYVSIGSGVDGRQKILGTFPTLDEAAGIYARAKYYLKQNGYPAEWKQGPESGALAGSNNDSDDEIDREDEMAAEHSSQEARATEEYYHW